MVLNDDNTITVPLNMRVYDWKTSSYKLQCLFSPVETTSKIATGSIQLYNAILNFPV